jgi:hypothetical protein
MNKEKRIQCFLVPFMNAFVGFWDITDFSLSRAFSQEIFGFLEFLTRRIKKNYKTSSKRSK